MSRSRPDLEPPQLEGYEFRQRLGRGGFSDVFLYEREFPRQQVAIKVLVGETLDEASRARFTAEANTMASLSTHPYIVSIYQAAISPQGHPYLVMEYYPGPNFSARARSEKFSVATALQVGIQVAAAVETAHRNGVLHRDIKPANVLTSEYGKPGLTDFGIAVTGEQHGSEAEGMSIPWSPPEVVSGSGVGDERADVYSLAATVYTLLAARSPFEVPGGQNRSIDLIDRISRTPLPSIERPDVPASLQRLLAQAMAKDPANRPGSAAELARALQVIEVEQRLAMTPFEVRQDPAGDAPAEPIDVDAGATNFKPGVIESQAPTSTQARRVSDTTSGITSATTGTYIRPAGSVPKAPVAGPNGMIAATPYVPSTLPPAPAEPAPAATGAAALYQDQASKHYTAPQPEAATPLWRRPPVLLAVGGALAVLALVVFGVSTLFGGEEPVEPEVAPTFTVSGIQLTARPTPEEANLVVATWSAPDAMPTDSFEAVHFDQERGATTTPLPFNVPELTFNGSATDCVRVTPIRDGRRGVTVSSNGCG